MYFSIRVIIEHAKGTERGSGGQQHGDRNSRDRGGSSGGGGDRNRNGDGYNNQSAGLRKQRARDKYV